MMNSRSDRFSRDGLAHDVEELIKSLRGWYNASRMDYTGCTLMSCANDSLNGP